MSMSKRIKHLSALIFDAKYRQKIRSLEKIRKCPRYTTMITDLLDFDIELVDAASFIHMYNAIFEKQIFKFYSE